MAQAPIGPETKETNTKKKPRLETARTSLAPVHNSEGTKLPSDEESLTLTAELLAHGVEVERRWVPEYGTTTLFFLGEYDALPGSLKDDVHRSWRAIEQVLPIRSEEPC